MDHAKLWHHPQQMTREASTVDKITIGSSNLGLLLLWSQIVDIYVGIGVQRRAEKGPRPM